MVHGGRPIAVAAGLATLCLVAACAPTPEEQVLARFFEASRALDSTLLDRLATVTLNPRTDGSIQTFTIAEWGAEQRAPLTDAQREPAIRSLSAPTGADVTLTGMSVEMISRDVTVDANVRTSDGAIAPEVLRVTLERAIGTRGNSTLDGRWIVTRLQRAPAARTSRGVSSVPRN
ncbi:MAG TPA: hypothetical protein VGF24_04340 [Vicinamibacterales bacterium]